MPRLNARLSLLAAIGLLSHALPARADSCPYEQAGVSTPPTSIVEVSVLSVRPNSDMEGDDDLIPGYNNRADIYGTVTIDGVAFDLPKISENDYPHWFDNGTFRQAATGPTAQITLQLWESDSGITFGDDEVDASPAANRNRLEVSFDLCALRVSGDINGPAGTILTTVAGSDDDDATVVLRIGTADGRPATSDDLAIVEADIVQVVRAADRLVTERPAVVLVRLANNFTVPVGAEISVRLNAAGIITDRIETVAALAPGEVRAIWIGRAAPFEWPASIAGQHVTMSVLARPLGVSIRYPPGDCRAVNDRIDRVSWKLVQTKNPRILWTKTGTLLDLTNFASDTDMNMTRELGGAFIAATYPVSQVHNHQSPLPIVPPVTAALDFVITILQAFGIPADCALPPALGIELNAVAVLSGHDALMGVVHRKWFDRFSDICGLDWLGQNFGLSSLLLPGETGYSMTAAAHELGHRYGLSVAIEPSSFWCYIEGLNELAFLCSREEYGDGLDGQSASGFWLAQGGEPAEVAPLTGAPQCPARCFMGSAALNDHVNWSGKDRWIDRRDYAHLLDELTISSGSSPPPPVDTVVVSGVASQAAVYLADIFVQQHPEPDVVDPMGAHLGVQLLDGAGRVLAEYALRQTYTLHGDPPLATFVERVPMVKGAVTVAIHNRVTNKVMASRPMSLTAPVVAALSPRDGALIPAKGGTIDLAWSAKDADGDAVTVMPLLRRKGENFVPLAGRLDGSGLAIAAEALGPGSYEWQLVAHDGAQLGTSMISTFVVR